MIGTWYGMFDVEWLKDFAVKLLEIKDDQSVSQNRWGNIQKLKLHAIKGVLG